LKNGVEIKGTLKTADQFFNLKLDNVSVANESKFPHLSSVKSIFIRGSTVRYVQISKNDVDTNLLQDAARREAMATSGKPIAGR
ncbi:U6 snRNA-associated Sm-like protein LSm2, partial [Cyberlindnera fabianii]